MTTLSASKRLLRVTVAIAGAKTIWLLWETVIKLNAFIWLIVKVELP